MMAADIWLVVLSTAGVGLSWLYYRSCLGSEEILNELVPLSREALERASKGEAPLVHFAAKVNSDAPIQCTHATTTSAVMYRMDHTLHLTRWDESLRRWLEIERTLASARRMVNGWLAPDPPVVARILISEDALSQASLDFELPTVHDEFIAAADGGLVAKATQYAQGELPRGTRIVEKALTVGTPLTVIGRVSSPQGGKFSVLSPNATEKGMLLLSKRDKDSIVRSFRGRSRFAWYVAVTISAAAAALLIYRLWKRRQHAAAVRAAKELDEAASAISGEECVVCMDKARAAVILPCGHLHTCMECTANLSDCPVCRRPIERVVRAFR